MALSSEALLGALRSATASSSATSSFDAEEVVMKLAKKNDQALLSFEISGQSRVGNRLRVAHDVRIEVMKPADVAKMTEPLCPTPDVRFLLLFLADNLINLSFPLVFLFSCISFYLHYRRCGQSWSDCVRCRTSWHSRLTIISAWWSRSRRRACMRKRNGQIVKIRRVRVHLLSIFLTISSIIIVDFENFLFFFNSAR